MSTTADFGGSAGRGQEARKESERGGLPCAVGTEERQAFARSEREGQSVNRSTGAEGADHRRRFDERRHTNCSAAASMREG